MLNEKNQTDFDIMTNGFFGHISGPFAVDEQVITKIQEQCLYQIDYISKIGIIYNGDLNLDVNNTIFPKIIVIINDIQFQIGKTKILELEDTKINSIKFKENTNDKIYIDYQYQKINNE